MIISLTFSLFFLNNVTKFYFVRTRWKWMDVFFHLFRFSSKYLRNRVFFLYSNDTETYILTRKKS